MGKNSASRKPGSLSSTLKKGMLGFVILVAISFFCSTYFIARRELRTYTISESESVLKTLSSNIHSDLQKYKELSRIIMTEEHLLTFLRARSESVDIGMINDARYGVMDVLNVTEGVDCLMIFREDLIMLATNRFTYKYDYPLMSGEEWKKDIYAQKGAVVAGLNSFGVAAKADGRPVVTIGRAIYDIDSQDRTGLMLMNISTSVYENMLGELGYSDNICIMGDDGTFLAGNRDFAELFNEIPTGSEFFYKNIRLDKKRMLLSKSQVADYPLVLLRVVPYGKEGIPYGVIAVLLILLAIFILVAIFIGNFIRKNITDPVLLLSDSMDKNIRSGDLKTIDVDMPSTELALLKDDYNSLIDHVHELIDSLIEKEKGIQRAEMRVLQEQIKPHFLYNSIETIGFMALDAGADNVHSALETLGSFYRNFLSKGDREIPLSREIWIVKDYLSLQKLRYGDIIEDEYDIAEDTLSLMVPKLILQPIVENSIYHGIRQKGEQGVIKISSSIKDGILHLIIRDTGVGMSREQIEEILSADNKSKDELSTESFGLWGTIERVRLFCGRDDVVNIESEIGEYTQIEFMIGA